MTPSNHQDSAPAPAPAELAAVAGDAGGTGAPLATQGRITIFWPQLVCGIIGLGLAIYTIYLHRLIEAGAATGCGISESISCDKVIGSKPWGEPFGIPLGVFGAAYFVAVLVTSVTTSAAKAGAALQSLAVAAVGILFSLGLEYVMWVILHHGCPVCMTTHFVTLLNFGFALATYNRLRRTASPPPGA